MRTPAEDLTAADEQLLELAVVDLACDGLVALDLKAEAIRRTHACQTPQAAAWLAGAAKGPARSLAARQLRPVHDIIGDLIDSRQACRPDGPADPALPDRGCWRVVLLRVHQF
jgi:hypothetical protein